jgi:hypothetical protein
MLETANYRILVAIETDATRYHGAKATRPALLGPGDAEQLLSHLAADLTTLLPDIRHCSLAAPGALFDQTQILRPNFPAFASLESLVSSGSRDGGFRPGLISIGTELGKIPIPHLQPLDDIPLGLLQLLPVVVHGEAGRLSKLGQTMEHLFLEQGQISAHSAQWLETAFGVSANHARFMTLTDLSAMFRLQLEHFGFLAMWELLDAAMGGHEERLGVKTESGQAFEWRDERVYTQFETFDYWAASGLGAERASFTQVLAGEYAEWTREMRQYLTTLRAHGVELCFHLPGEDGKTLAGSYFREKSVHEPSADAATVTEHSFAELGTIAVSVVHDGVQHNYYPLLPQGLNDIHGAINASGVTDPLVSFPGTIVYEEETRCLAADAGARRRP